MVVRTATLVTANAIDIVHNLWELTLLFDDDLVNAKKYKVRSRYPFNDSEIQRFNVTLKGEKITKIEPLS